jgi:hypothetical protein
MTDYLSNLGLQARAVYRANDLRSASPPRQACLNSSGAPTGAQQELVFARRPLIARVIVTHQRRLIALQIPS